MRLMQQISKGKRIDDEAAFLFTAATNLALNQLRNSKRRRELLDQNRGPSETTPQLDVQLTVRKLLSVVSEDEARIAAYYYLASMDQEEIAGLLDINRRKVGRRLESFRAHARRFATQGVAHA